MFQHIGNSEIVNIFWLVELDQAKKIFVLILNNKRKTNIVGNFNLVFLFNNRMNSVKCSFKTNGSKAHKGRMMVETMANSLDVRDFDSHSLLHSK